jgi:Glycosyltransferase family 87
MDAGFRNRAETALDRFGWWPIAIVLAFDAALMPWLAHPYDTAAFLTHADRVFFAHVRAATLWPYGGVTLAAVMLSQLPVAAFPQLYAAAPVRIALLKIPMLIADGATSLIIRRCSGATGGNLWALRYLLDPIVFFVTVVHGQTDALAGVFAVGGIALMMSGRFELAALALGLGTGAKLYPAAFVPLLLITAYRNGSPARAMASAAYFAAAAGLTLLPVLAGRTGAFAGSFANNSFGAESRRVESASPWALFNALVPFVRAAYEQLTVVVVPVALAFAELRHRPQRADIARAAMLSALAVVMLDPGAHPPFYLWVAGPLVLYCAVTRDGIVSAIGAVLSATAVAMQFCQEGSDEYLLLNFGFSSAPGALGCVAPNAVLLGIASIAAVALVVASYRQPMLSVAHAAAMRIAALATAAGASAFLGCAFTVAIVMAALLNGSKALGFAREMDLVNTFAIDPVVRAAGDSCELIYDASDLIVYADNSFAAPYGSAALAYTLFAPETMTIRGRPLDLEALPQRFENIDARTVEQRDVRVTREFDVSALLRPFRYVERFVERPCGEIPGNPLLIYRFDGAAAARDAAHRPFWQRFGQARNLADRRRVRSSVP